VSQNRTPLREHSPNVSLTYRARRYGIQNQSTPS
jgi:hypothetical protein